MTKAPFCYFYWNILSRFGLSPIEGLFLTLVEGLSHKRKEVGCYASRSRLAKYLNVSETAIYDLIARLRKKKLLIRFGRTKHGTIALKVSNEVAEFIQKEKYEWLKESDEDVR